MSGSQVTKEEMDKLNQLNKDTSPRLCIHYEAVLGTQQRKGVCPQSHQLGLNKLGSKAVCSRVSVKVCNMPVFFLKLSTFPYS